MTSQSNDHPFSSSSVSPSSPTPSQQFSAGSVPQPPPPSSLFMPGSSSMPIELSDTDEEMTQEDDTMSNNYMDMTTEEELAAQDEAGQLLLQVKNALKADAGKTLFAVGGTIPLNPERPVVIRWDDVDIPSCDDDADELGVVNKCTLPLPDGVDFDSWEYHCFNKLVRDCQPATFGKGNEDVLDEEYRKAGQMGERRFCTSFNLGETGILETVTQVLVQGTWFGGVSAELYKLNVYSGPSGKFKAHVDTPRAPNQIGSLVVCLPSWHKGGALVVRHGDRHVLFDWAKKSGEAIQWAALFSDCEHEVLHVPQGDRVTLTYNLYVDAGGPAGMATQLQAIDQESLHFYAALKELIECPTFLPKGGLLGFDCAHYYPHTSCSLIEHKRLDCMMKGIDMAVFQALSRFSSEVHCEAVLQKPDIDDEDEYCYEHSDCDEGPCEMKSENYERKKEDRQFPLGERVIVSDGPPAAFGLENNYDDNGDFPAPEEYESRFQEKHVTWLNHGATGFKELAMAYMTYGNEASGAVAYSAAAIIAQIAPYEERMKLLEKSCIRC